MLSSVYGLRITCEELLRKPQVWLVKEITRGRIKKRIIENERQPSQWNWAGKIVSMNDVNEIHLSQQIEGNYLKIKKGEITNWKILFYNKKVKKEI